jgi:L-lactate dehydrogenase complex protein LldE
MIKTHYTEMLADDPAWAKRAEALAAKTFELTQFLRDVMKWDGIAAKFSGSTTYHDSCSSLRELKVKGQPRALLGKVDGLSFKELPDAEPCCGFGGTFCVKFPDISNKMVEAKIDNIQATGAEMVLAADMGCLLNIAGKLKRAGSKVQARHVAEVLAGMTSEPAIGEGS